MAKSLADGLIFSTGNTLTSDKVANILDSYDDRLRVIEALLLKKEEFPLYVDGKSPHFVNRPNNVLDHILEKNKFTNRDRSRSPKSRKTVSIESNQKSSNNIMIIVRLRDMVKFEKKNKNAVEKYILKCFDDDRLAHVQAYGTSTPFCIVSNVKTDPALIDCAEDEFFLPEYVFAIRIGEFYDVLCDHVKSASELVVLSEESPDFKRMEVRADLLKNIFCDLDAPSCVSEIGISAVSENFMKNLWREIIRKDENWCCRSGGGYMVHPMWIKYGPTGVSDESWGDWMTIRERSFNFGWENYNEWFEKESSECDDKG